MSDLEMTKLCAEAMGYRVLPCVNWAGEPYVNPPVPVEDHPHHRIYYNPLHDDAQCFALAKSHPELFEDVVTEWASMIRCGERPDLNRMLCERVAKEAR